MPGASGCLLSFFRSPSFSVPQSPCFVRNRFFRGGKSLSCSCSVLLCFATGLLFFCPFGFCSLTFFSFLCALDFCLALSFSSRRKGARVLKLPLARFFPLLHYAFLLQ